MSREHVPPLRFAFLTPLYDWTVGWSSAESRFRPALVDLVVAAAPRTVLELGCGTGTLTRLIAHAVPAANVIGIDADQDALQIAKRKIEPSDSVRFLQADARQLPAVPAVDAVVTSLFFHHLDRDGRRRVLGEIHRVLRPEGTFFIADWAAPRSLREKVGFYAVRMLDGYERTAAHASGLFAGEVSGAGFSVRECAAFSAAVGRIMLWSARKASAPQLCG